MQTLEENRFFSFFSWKIEVREFLLYVAIDPHASEYLSTLLHILWARRFRPGVITHHGPLCDGSGARIDFIAGEIAVPAGTAT